MMAIRKMSLTICAALLLLVGTPLSTFAKPSSSSTQIEQNKKINLEDIEQDMLQSERQRQNAEDSKEDEYQQTEQSNDNYVSHIATQVATTLGIQHHHEPQYHHQYDVEENHVQDEEGHQQVAQSPAGIVYAHQQQQYSEDYHQSSVDQNSIEQPVYGHQVAMQIVYVPQYQQQQQQEQQLVYYPTQSHPLQQYAYYVQQPQPLPAPHQHEPIPKVLPQYAHEVSRPIYSHISGNLVDSGHHQNQYQNQHQQPGSWPYYRYTQHTDSLSLGQVGEFTHRTPGSLLESYIPSSIQIEYLKRGLSRDPLSTYETIARTRGFPATNFGGVTSGYHGGDTGEFGPRVLAYGRLFKRRSSSGAYQGKKVR